MSNRCAMLQRTLTRVRRSRECVVVSGALYSWRVLSDWYISTMIKYIMHLQS